MIFPDMLCNTCGDDVWHDKDLGYLYCSCPGRKVSEEYLLQGGRPPSWTTSSGWFRLPNVPQPTPPADPSNCASCGKGMEIVGLNRSYPPKRDPNGHAICPHCRAVQDPSGGTAPSTSVADQTVTLFGDAPGREQWEVDGGLTAKELEEALKQFGNATGTIPASTDLPEIFSMMDYDSLSPIQLSLLWAAEGCSCFRNRPGPYNSCELHGNAGGVGSPTDERGMWLIKDAIKKPGIRWAPSTELATLTVDMDAHFRLLMDDLVKRMATKTDNIITWGNEV